MDKGIKFVNCRLVLELEAQSPMIHFQSEELGATLRASEVKPKLDKFLIKKMETSDKKYDTMLINGQEMALNYKMRIQVKGEICKIEINDGNFRNKQKKYDIFYGNMGVSNPKDKKYGIISSPIITIICFNKELRTWIENSIEEFFLVTNFGTMQGKGFGSFAPASYNQILSVTEKEKVGKWLKVNADAAKCYIMEFKNKDMTTKTRALSAEEINSQCKTMLNEVKVFYSDMKSGISFGGYDRSFIYDYMHKKGINNEKAWMKQKGIAPIIAKEENKKKQDVQDKNPYYVRALLGIGEHIQFINDINMPSDKATITIKDKLSEVERFPSPIFFKVVRNVVFIVARRIDPIIYDREFSFTSSISKGHNEKAEGSINVSKTGTIKTLPEKLLDEKSFDIDDFLDSYVKHYNGKLRENVNKINHNVKVGVIRGE